VKKNESRHRSGTGLQKRYARETKRAIIFVMLFYVIENGRKGLCLGVVKRISLGEIMSRYWLK
jgi:hypothetical protein